jgi:DNA-binding NtrC family response regulator
MADGKKHPILLVDDEPEILYSLKGLLRREFELYTAESAKQALEILAHHTIHVVMTDQRMPEMTGVELMARMKTAYPDAIRIVFTGYADIKAVIDAINNGGLFRYITKPWDPDELIDVLREAAAKYVESVERRQLLLDLRSYVEQSQKLVGAAGPEGAAATGDSGDVQQLAETGKELLERLNKAIGG